MDEIQRIVDEVGARLERAAAVDDSDLRLQAYSPHFGPVDQTRLNSILHREAPDYAKEYVFSLGIADSEGPFRVPSNEDLEMMARVGAPIRFQDTHLGYLWLTDSDESLSDEDLRIVQDAADSLGVVMYRNGLLQKVERGREGELLRDLFSEESALRDHARIELIEQDFFVRGGQPVAFVLQPLAPEGSTLAEEERTALERTLEAGRWRVSARHAMQLVRLNHGVLILAGNDRALKSEEKLVSFAEELRNTLAGRLPEEWRAVVGIGEVQPDLSTAHVSYRQARQAVRIVEVAPSFGEIAAWSSLGVYRVLSQLPPEDVRNGAVHPGLSRLFDREGGLDLVRTLETYLDHAGDVQATAEALSIHRATLYYRLSRVEELAEVSLKNGDDRLALHLSLKVARLAGIHA